MLCALNRDRRQQLPTDRVELYEACCSLLLERRDKERRIELSDYPALNYRQKRLLLEDMAYWMIKNEWSEVALEHVDERFARKLKDMPGITPDISGSGVRRLFMERSGIIRALDGFQYLTNLITLNLSGCEQILYEEADKRTGEAA